MKCKYVAAAITVAVVIFSLAALAQKQAQRDRVFLLKSGGETIAELHLPGSTSIAIQSANSSGHSDYNVATGAMVAKGGAILTLSTGTNSISVRADEIESVPDSK
jgi:hypothetical protein